LLEKNRRPRQSARGTQGQSNIFAWRLSDCGLVADVMFGDVVPSRPKQRYGKIEIWQQWENLPPPPAVFNLCRRP
jgi:hypothetical protein